MTKLQADAIVKSAGVKKALADQCLKEYRAVDASVTGCSVVGSVIMTNPPKGPSIPIRRALTSSSFGTTSDGTLAGDKKWNLGSKWMNIKAKGGLLTPLASKKKSRAKQIKKNKKLRKLAAKAAEDQLLK